jgi:hypothetical protein
MTATQTSLFEPGTSQLNGREQLEHAQKQFGHQGPELREYLRRLFMERNLIEDTSWFNEMLDAWFQRVYSRPTGETTRAAYTAERDKITKTLRSQIAEREHQIRVECQVALLTLIMSNGKPLGECTFREIELMAGTFGPFLERLAKRGRPGQKIKTIMTEEQLHELWKSSGTNSPRNQ